jgi:hypothetical protein
MWMDHIVSSIGNVIRVWTAAKKDIRFAVLELEQARFAD